MRLLPPKLRNLTSKNGGTSSAALTSSTEIWEIGVPAKNSLYWSIVISYLRSASDKEFSNYLKRITGSKTVVAEIKKRKGMSTGKIHTDAVRQELRTFNPFKNRFTVFHGINIEEAFRIFIVRLNRKSLSIKCKDDSWNDELKLKAAAQLLNCIIEVYFADEPNQKKVTYRTTADFSDFQPRIILFQYKDQAHKNRKQNINIFYFGMNVQEARCLKLNALAYVMKKAKISNECIEHVKQLMKEEEESHGLSFLPSILKSKWISVLPYLYKSPYIALKLHEAGFETDPTAVKVNNLSSLYYASINTDIKYIRILYDYASNCGCLLDKSVRNADETVLKTLETLKSTLDDDIQQIEQVGTEQRSLNILKQYSQFLKYQFQTVSEIESSKTSIGAGSEVHLRKEVVKSILEHYLKFFRFNLSKDNISETSENVCLCESEIFDNYLQFSEFYENIDNFACTILFDNFYLLKKNLGVKYESLTSSIEMKIFFVILSNKYFLQYETVYDKEVGKGNKNVLAHIPFYHRNVLKAEIKTFVNYLKSERDLRNIKDILRVKNDLGRYCPEILDELMMTRLQKYITAALDISPRDDGIKAVLAVEKALQVIGESIKPPSSSDRISSHFLRSCLPRSLQRELINIRNTLSHNRNNIVQGKLNLEKDLEFWDDIGDEISKMQDAFEIVGKLQSHRTMMFLMNSAMTEVIDEKLKQELIKVFNQKHNKTEKEREISNRYHTKYLNLLLNIINDLKENIKEAGLYEKYEGKSPQREILIPGILMPLQEILKYTQLQEQERQIVRLKRTDTPGTTTATNEGVTTESNKFILGSIKAMEYLLNYLYKQTSNEDYNILLMDAKKLTCAVDDNPLSETYLNRLNLLISKCTDKLSESSEEFASYPKTESIYNKMSQNQFTGEDLDQIITAVNEAYEESEEAKEKLKTHIKNSHILTEEEIEELLIKIILRCDLSKLRDSLKRSNVEEFLNEYSISFKTLVSDVVEMMSKNRVKACGAKTLLTKIAFQKYLTNEIYLQVSLSTCLCTKLEEFLMRKKTYLLNRLRTLKRILIEEDEEINRAWTWGRSHAMKYHMKFLMRQRYIREMKFRAPLETVFFDCLNILNMKDFEELREKQDKLFTGVDLRHVISHMSLFDVIGGILDEDDFPSAIITKMLELIEDTKAIKCMSELFRKCNTLERERFKACIENCDYNPELVKQIKRRNWQNYLILFPWL